MPANNKGIGYAVHRRVQLPVVNGDFPDFSVVRLLSICHHRFFHWRFNTTMTFRNLLQVL